MSQRQRWIITIGCFFSYVLFGLVDNIKGPTVPVILSETGYAYSAGGMIVLSEYAGFFLATFLAGVIADILGKKSTLILAGGCLIFGVIGYAASSDMILLSSFIFFIGLGLGSLELSGSNIISELYHQKKGRYLNLLNAFYGIGAVITPMLAGYYLGNGGSWRSFYRYSLLVIVPVTIYFIIMRYPGRKKGEEQSEKINIKEMIQVIAKKEMLLMYLVVFSYVAAEIGMATWMVDFLQNDKQLPVMTSSLYLSGLFIGMTIGRLLGSLFVDRIGHMRSLLIFLSLAAVCIVLGTFGTSRMAVILALTGFFYSIVFPTATAVMSEVALKKSGTVLGLFLACGGIGGMIGPWLIGIVNDVMGLKAGMMMNAVYCLVAAGVMAILMKMRKSI